MSISLIAACGENGVIGCDGQLPWRLPADMKLFRESTLGCPVIMGRKTYESIGRPLPHRTNVVVTASGRLIRGAEFPEGVLVAPDPLEALRMAYGAIGEGGNIWVVGGSQIYQAFLDLADCLLLTVVDCSPPGDTYFPDFSEDNWQLESMFAEFDPGGYLVSSTEKAGLNYTVKSYKKRKRNDDQF